MTPYQKYQLRWMIDHNISLDDLMNSMTEYQLDGCEGTVAEIFDEWESNSNGFGGEIWACIGEWKECEKKTVIDAMYEQYVHDKYLPDDEEDEE